MYVHRTILFIVESGKLVFNPDFLLSACWIPGEDPIPLIQSPKGANTIRLGALPNEFSKSFQTPNIIYMSVFFFVSFYDDKC